MEYRNGGMMGGDGIPALGGTADRRPDRVFFQHSILPSLVCHIIGAWGRGQHILPHKLDWTSLYVSVTLKKVNFN